MAGTVHAGIRTEIHNLHAPPSKALDVLACEYPSTHLHRQHVVVVAASILEANYTAVRVLQCIRSQQDMPVEVAAESSEFFIFLKVNVCRPQQR